MKTNAYEKSTILSDGSNAYADLPNHSFNHEVFLRDKRFLSAFSNSENPVQIAWVAVNSNLSSYWGRYHPNKLQFFIDEGVIRREYEGKILESF